MEAEVVSCSMVDFGAQGIGCKVVTGDDTRMTALR